MLTFENIESGTNPILDLTYLLTTGRASDALLDLLGSGEQTSDRVGTYLSYSCAVHSCCQSGPSKMGNNSSGCSHETKGLI